MKGETYIHMTDQHFDSCMQRICNGDKDGLHEIYEEYLTYIYSVVCSILKNKENSEDICSDFFIKLWTNAEKYKPGTGHKTYLTTIARNMCIDFLRKQGRETLISDFEETGDEESNGGTLSIGEIGRISEKCSNESVEETVVGDMSIKEAFDKLKPAEREVVNMKIMGEMTFQDISNALGKPMGTVTWLYRQAIEKLRRCGYEES